jgi:hypothetical protein
MKAAIEVESKKEAELIRQGLADKDVRAFVLVTGALLSLPDDRARRRALRYAADLLNIDLGSVTAPP